MDSIDLFDDFNEEEDRRMGDYEEGDGDDENNEHDPITGESSEQQKQDVDPGIKVVKVKRKLVTLNAERLKGPRGIVAIDDFFQNIKLKGRGHEHQDLKDIMKRMEHWAHRLFPKYNFDDSLAKIERLGRKKEITTHMARYRLGQLIKEDEENKNVLSDDDDRDRNDTLANELPIDEFEELINQQIALSSSALPSTTFGGNISGISGISHAPQSSQYINSQPQTPKLQLTDEQKAKIEENKKRALAIREAKMKEREIEQQKNDLPIDEFDEMIDEQIALSTSKLPSATFDDISNISAVSQTAKEPSPQPAKMKLTEEQKAMIEENKKKAMAIRDAKLKKQQEESKKPSDKLTNQIFSDLLFDDDF